MGIIKFWIGWVLVTSWKHKICRPGGIFNYLWPWSKHTDSNGANCYRRFKWNSLLLTIRETKVMLMSYPSFSRDLSIRALNVPGFYPIDTAWSSGLHITQLIMTNRTCNRWGFKMSRVPGPERSWHRWWCKEIFLNILFIFLPHSHLFMLLVKNYFIFRF